MFRHSYVVIREVLHLFLAKLPEYLKLKLLKSQFNKIIKIKHFIVV